MEYEADDPIIIKGVSENKISSIWDSQVFSSFDEAKKVFPDLSLEKSSERSYLPTRLF